MDTRIGFPGEHLAGDSDEYNPIYSTAVGLLMKAIENNSENKNSILTQLEMI
jgi:cell division protein FtsA